MTDQKQHMREVAEEMMDEVAIEFGEHAKYHDMPLREATPIMLNVLAATLYRLLSAYSNMGYGTMAKDAELVRQKAIAHIQQPFLSREQLLNSQREPSDTEDKLDQLVGQHLKEQREQAAAHDLGVDAVDLGSYHIDLTKDDPFAELPDNIRDVCRALFAKLELDIGGTRRNPIK